MRRLRILAWLLVPIVLGFAAFGHRAGIIQREWASIMRTDPVYNAPAEVQAPVVEIGQVATAQFTMANRGGGELVISGITASCACSGLERSTGDGYARIEELRLGPGESAPIVVRLIVRDASEEPQRYVIRFRTSDPTRPEAMISIILPPIPRGIAVAPAGFNFGAVSIGATVHEVFQVYVPEEQRRSITHVAASDPRVSVRLLPDGGEPDVHGRGVSIGAIDLTVRTNEPAEVNASVTILVDGDGPPPPPVAVSGRIKAPIEVAPRTITLPIASSSGPINEATCLFRSTDGKPFDLLVETCPRGFEVEVQEPVNENQGLRTARIRLRAVSDASRSSASSRLLVGFVARYDKSQTRIEVPIRINSDIE
jgi:hypothetical protein